MSDSYLWVYFFSAQLMTMMNPVLCSKLMELDTENFVYMNLTTTVLGLLTLPIVIYVYGYLRKKGVLKVIDLKKIKLNIVIVSKSCKQKSRRWVQESKRVIQKRRNDGTVIQKCFLFLNQNCLT